jgi:UDP-glucose:(galactosyl)LPS alpha-1,2-glucosyltransferase
MVPSQIFGRPLPAPAEFHVAFGSDSRYIPAVAASIHSILAHNRNLRILFHIVTTALSPADLFHLASFADQNAFPLQLHFIPPQRLASLPKPGTPRFSGAIYYRLLLPEILAGVVRRVIYLDADIICLGSIASIAGVPMEGKIAAAVPDVPRSQAANKRNIGLVSDEPYFNSGVLYIDVDNWNLAHVTQDVVRALLSSDGRFPYPDQDALNTVLAGKVSYLDRRWNTLFVYMEADADTVFLHYLNDKPWQVWSQSFRDPPFAASILHTPWPHWEDRSPLSRSQRTRHAEKLLGAGNILAGLYWYARAWFTPRFRGQAALGSDVRHAQDSGRS